MSNKTDTAEMQARAQVESICASVDALDCDYARLDELRELAKKPRYVAGWNMPGYLPDSEPAEFDNADDAGRYVLHAIKFAEDCAENESMAENLCAFAADVSLCSAEFSEVGPDGFVYWVTQDGVMPLDDADAEELAELENQAGDFESEEEAREAIQNGPLSIELRSGWTSSVSEFEAEEFRIVLCTGGPHVEIVGDLARDAPSRVRVLYRDWGTSGELFDFDHDAVLTYCQQFYFGE